MKDVKFIESPMEDVFGIDKGSTVSTIQKISHNDEELEYEGIEDKIIDTQLSTVYDYAIEGFEAQNEMTQTVDPKFAARNAEVAAQYLKIALDSTESRAKNKNDKAKLRIAAGKSSAPGTVNNNLIISNRNDILKLIAETKD